MKYIIIPARLDSVRLPQKLLLNKTGKYLIQHTYERAIEIEGMDKVYIATDSPRIEKAAKSFGAETIMTGQADNGTRRVYLATRSLGLKKDDTVIGLQGDCPNFYKNVLFRMLK